MNYLLASISWTILVILASLMPGNALPSSGITIPHFDKVVHVAMYTGTVYLWLKYSNTLTPENVVLKLVLMIVLAGFLLGLLLELMQYYFIENRNFESLDLIANGFGCIFGGTIFYKLNKTSF